MKGRGVPAFFIKCSAMVFLKPELRLQDRFENFLLQNIKRSENAKRGWEKTLFQIEKPDDLQIIANLIRFFVCMTPAMMEITKNSLAVILPDGSALIYQALHLSKSLPFTDKSMKMDRLSVNGLL